MNLNTILNSKTPTRKMLRGGVDFLYSYEKCFGTAGFLPFQNIFEVKEKVGNSTKITYLLWWSRGEGKQTLRVCLAPLWWSRGESNSCPKATWKELLRVQFVIYIPSSGREQTPCRIW